MQKTKRKNLTTLKRKKKITNGIVYINATFNNTLVTITDWTGNVYSWSSAGACGFRGAKKSTPFAAQTAVRVALQPCIDRGLQTAEVILCGPGSGRETALRAVHTAGVRLPLIRDITPVPHIGCRPKKKRRI